MLDCQGASTIQGRRSERVSGRKAPTGVTRLHRSSCKEPVKAKKKTNSRQ